MMWLAFLAGIGVGVIVGAWLIRRLVDNDVQSAYDTGYHDGARNAGKRKVF